MITLYLLPLLLLSVIPAYIAQTKGKSFGAWYVYGLFLLPITFVHSLILDRDDRKCPHCAELVKLEATVCKHCGNKLDSKSTSDRPISKVALERYKDIQSKSKYKQPKMYEKASDSTKTFFYVIVLCLIGVISLVLFAIYFT